MYRTGSIAMEPGIESRIGDAYIFVLCLQAIHYMIKKWSKNGF